jgi:hypothetical protein
MTPSMYMNIRHLENSRGSQITKTRERGTSDGTGTRLRLARDELRNVIKLGFRLSKARFDNSPLRVQRPESVAEQVRRVIFSFELHEPIPVRTKTGLSFFCVVAATEELKVLVRNHN